MQNNSQDPKHTRIGLKIIFVTNIPIYRYIVISQNENLPYFEKHARKVKIMHRKHLKKYKLCPLMNYFFQN